MEFQHKNSASEKYLETSRVSTWPHRAWLGLGCAAALFSITKSVLLTARAPRPWLASTLAAVAGYLAADLGTGVYHWAIDNYGSARTPIFGPQILGFLGHHRRPWAITRFHLAKNLYETAATVAFVALPIALASADPVVLMFVGAMAVCVIFSQQFHAWAHTPKRRLPRAVVALQDAGIILPRAEHAAHHQPPFSSNYCIVSGLWNGILDRSSFFVGLEVVVDRVLGYRPRSWVDPNPESALN